MTTIRTSTRGRGAALVLLLALAAAAHAQFLDTPQPGSLFKEYSRSMVAASDWRVTDPNTPRADAQQYLPNATLSLNVADLTGATRAELLIDLWGGHVGTTNKRFRFNSNAWISIPELGAANGIPAGHDGQCYNNQFNPVIAVPLSHLQVGNNTFQGTSGGQTCYNFNWGQWGWNGVVLRVYYGTSKPHPTGSITSPDGGTTIGDNPVVNVSTSGSVAEVRVLAYYSGFDPDGDGIRTQYNYAYHRFKSETTFNMKYHVGTDNASPYSLTWNNALVPDQGGIKLMAMIKGTDGTIFVTNEVTNITLSRSGAFVRAYPITNMPERFWVRSGRTTKTVNFTIPTGDNLANARSATIVIPNWNGDDVSERGQFNTKVNTWTTPIYGSDHLFQLDFITVPLSALRQGVNDFTVTATTVEHGIEIMWPGPHVIVRYGGSASTLPPSITGQPENQTVAPGQTAVFSVSATGTGTLSYQWQRNNVNISGATSASYTTPPTTTNDNGATFRCIVTNAYGNATSNSATLTVTSGNLPPTVTENPQNRTVGVGQTATFSVVATGTSPLSYQWQRNNVNITGALAASYTSPATSLLDNGATFRCIVSNPYGADTSSSATLTVTDVPPPAGNLLQNPGFESGTGSWSFFTNGAGTYTSATPGQMSTRAARIAISTEGTNVQLYQSALRLEPNTEYRLSFFAFSTGGRDLSLYVHKAVSPFTNYGLSNAVANLTTGWREYSFTFRTTGFTAPVTDGRVRFWLAPFDAPGETYWIDNVVLAPAAPPVEPPVITVHPAPQTVVAGSPAGFGVTATGVAPLTYQWQRDGVDIPGAQAASYTLPAAGVGDNGALFRCVVSNGGGSVTSSAAQLTVLSAEPGATPWWNTAWRFRVRMEIGAAGYARTDMPAAVPVNFTQLLQQAGVTGALDRRSLRVIEVSSAGGLEDSLVSFQFEPDSTYDSVTHARGTLVIELAGELGALGVGLYDVYFDLEGTNLPAAPVTPLVTWEDGVQYQGQESFRITTPSAVYTYHKEGSGFAALVDIAGNDWISYRPTGGSAGNFRGIPNLGDAFHPGYTNGNSSILASGPLRVVIRSHTDDGLWDGTWAIYPAFAHFTLRARGANYWFLYEGTPGGLFNTTDFMYRANGVRTRLDGSWSGDMAGPEWVYFGDLSMRRTVYVAHHEEDTAPDMYRQMEGNMTVFGFGRDNVPCCPKFMTAVPQNFTIGFAEDSAFAAVQAVVLGATKPLTHILGPVQERPSTISGGRILNALKEAVDLPREFAVHQNFPNPFNPVTSIRFDLPEDAPVTLTVFDLLGRVVAEVAQGRFAAGRHEVRFDAASLPSGVYLYRVEAGGRVETRRLVLLK